MATIIANGTEGVLSTLVANGTGTVSTIVQSSHPSYKSYKSYILKIVLYCPIF